jgi:hypothetical protein
MTPYLDLVREYFNPTVNNFLHMLGVEVTEAEMLHSIILLDEFKSVNILIIIILVHMVR